MGFWHVIRGWKKETNERLDSGVKRKNHYHNQPTSLPTSTPNSRDKLLNGLVFDTHGDSRPSRDKPRVAYMAVQECPVATADGTALLQSGLVPGVETTPRQLATFQFAYSGWDAGNRVFFSKKTKKSGLKRHETTKSSTHTNERYGRSCSGHD